MNPPTTEHEPKGTGTTPLLVWGRRALFALAAVILSVVVLAALLLAALQIDAVSSAVVRTGAGVASSDSLSIRVAGATGSWVRGLELTGIEVEGRYGGAPVWTLSADTLSAGYDLLPLLRRHVSVSTVRAAGIEAWVASPVDDDEPAEDAPAASAWTVAVGRAEVDIRMISLMISGAEDPWVLTDGHLRLEGMAMGPDGLEGVLDTLEASFRPPGRPAGWGRIEASGSLEADGMHIAGLQLRSPESDVGAWGTVPLTLAGTAPAGLELDVALAPLHFGDVAPFLPETIPDSLRLRGEGRLWVADDTAYVHFTAATNVPGRVTLDGQIWGPRDAPDVAGHVELAGLDARAWGFGERALVLDGAARVAIRDVSTEEIGSMHGSIAAEARAYDADGSLGEFRLEAGADATGAPWRGGWTASGLGLDGSGAATLRLTEVPEWALDGAVSYLATDADPSLVANDTGEAPAFRPVAAAASFEAEGRGFDPDSLTGRMRVRTDSLLARIGDRTTLTRIGPGEASADIERGSVALRLAMEAGGGRMDLDAEGDIPTRTIRTVRGAVADVDIASLSGDTLTSSVNADFSGEMASMSPLQASGELRVHHTSYGAWTLDSARASADARADEVFFRVSAALPDSARFGARGTIQLDDGAVRQAAVDSLAWSDMNLRDLAAAVETSPIPSSALNGSGQGEAVLGDEGWTGSMVLLVAPSTVGLTIVDGGTIRVETTPELSRLSLVLEAGEVLFEAEAHASDTDAGPRVVVPELRFREVDLAALLAGDVTPTRLTGSASGEMVGSTPEQAVGAVRLDLGNSSIGTTVLDTASVTLSADSGRVHGQGRIDGLGGSVRLEGEAGVGGPSPTYSVLGTIERPGVDEGGFAVMARFGLAGHGVQPDSMDAEVWLEADSARWAGHDVERGSFRAGLTAGVARLDTLSLVLPGGELAGGGELPLASEGGRRGEIRLTGTLTGADLVRGLREAGVLAMGGAGMDVVARGAVDDVEIDGEAFVTALLFDDIRVQGVEVQGSGRRTAAEGWVRGRGTLGIDRVRLPTAPIESLEVVATLEADDELAITASAVIDGRRDAELSMRVEQLPAPAAIRLESMSFRADEDRWTLAHPTRVTLQDGFQVDSLRLGAAGQRLELRGRIGAEGPLDFHADAEAVDIATVADLLGYPSLRGRLSGEVGITGAADAPVVQARLQSRLVPQNAPAANLALSVGYDEGAARLDASVTLDDGPSLRTEASVPFHLSFASPSDGLVGETPMRGSVTADAFPLRWFEPFLAGSGARDLEGRLDGAAEMEGDLDDPSFRGRLDLRDGGVTLPELGVRYRDAAAHLTLRGTDVLIDSARVRSEDGFLSSSGIVRVSQIDNPSYELTVEASQFTVMRSSAIHAAISGLVDVRGTGLSPAVTGHLDVERADLYLEDLLTGSNVDAVTLTTAHWDELASVFGYMRPDERAETSPLMDVITLDLDVRLGRASWVRQRSNPELALQFSGEMSLQKQPGDSLQLAGSVEAVPDRSWVEQFGRRFAITQGIVTFQGLPSATMVEVQAEYEVPSRENPGEPEVVLMLSVSGTPEDLALELSSTPTLEASDMVAYLVTGRPASQSLSGGGEGSLTDAGGALALGRLSGAVESYAREQVGLDVVEITTDGLDGMTLLAGRYLSPDLYLGVRQPITLQRSEDPTQRAPTTELELELQAVRWLLLNLRGGGRRGIEFYVRSRIAYD